MDKRFALLGVVLLCAVVIGVFVGWLLAAAAVIAGVGMFYALKQQDDSKSAQEQEEQPKDSKSRIDSLVRLNLDVRMANIDRSLMSLVEKVIDQLVDLMPQLEQSVGNGELKWVVERMADVYLPDKAVAPYLSLSEEDRSTSENVDAMRESLQVMLEELNSVQEILRTQDQTEFDKKAMFLKQKFSV